MKKDRIEAMKLRDMETKNVLTVFIGDMQTLEKRGTVIDDTLVIQQIKKAIANSEDNLKIKQNDQDAFTVRVLSGYLPRQMTAVEITPIISEKVSQGASMGEVMGYLKNEYGGLYEGKMAAVSAKALIG